MTIFLIILFCLCLGYCLGHAHCESPDEEGTVAGICFCICLLLLIPLIYSVGQWAGFWA